LVSGGAWQVAHSSHGEGTLLPYGSLRVGANTTSACAAEQRGEWPWTSVVEQQNSLKYGGAKPLIQCLTKGVIW